MRDRLKLKREWTAAEADQWSKEDFVAVTLAVLAFVSIAIGTPYAFLLRPVGFALFLGGLAAGVLMLWIIGPKLDAVSAGYEKKQKRYLEDLEKRMRWEELDG
jgi:hypothetical protein